MRSLTRTLSRFNEQGKKLRRLQTSRKRDFQTLFPHVRIAILLTIYDEANGDFPHDFDPSELVKKIKFDGHPINRDLFWATFEQFGAREKCDTRDGSFDIEHHFCTGEVALRMVRPHSES